MSGEIDRDTSPGHFASPYRDGSVPPKCPAPDRASHFTVSLQLPYRGLKRDGCRPPREAPGARRLHRLDVRFRQRDDNRRVSVHTNNSEFGRTARRGLKIESMSRPMNYL
jgi:hypothetical protein